MFDFFAAPTFLWADALEWVAFGCGTVGTLIWAWRPHRVAEAVFWLLSALLWVVFALSQARYGLAARDALGAGLYAAALLRWRSGRDHRAQP